MTTPSDALVSVRDLSKVFKLEAGIFASAGRWVWAVTGVSFDILRGETYGLVGESGSGKTTVARCIVQLVPHSAGTIRYFPTGDDPRTGGWQITPHDSQTVKRLRSEVKYIFQDPSSSLDPRMSVLSILTAGSATTGWSCRPLSLKPGLGSSWPR